MPTYKIEGCTVADAAALACNNMSAFWTDATWLLNWEDQPLEYIIAQCTKRMPTVLTTDRAHRRHQKVIDAETGAVMGYARWILPDRLTGEWLEAQTPAVSTIDEKAFMELFSSATWISRSDVNNLGKPLQVIMDRLMRGKEYLELDYLAVHPDYRGRGIATMLVESGIAESERMGVDVIVMAYKAAVGLYKRIGFDTLESLIQDTSKYGGASEFGAYFMVRNVRRDP
ncbi:hypothetical protein NKR23_g11968 [Pleurostoma richardsiae]|uniref:N-acetyltransferase domain-containing protein n=1 Tax=Pleurostoma richardsiae TaxID=41990 RepID=A0AA38RFX1_9PEZI|nr:hypothetical protein NKR23_g11968 [Pleurostoma richardsiae]